jgi:hypothetical protein
MSYAMTVRTQSPFADLVPRVRGALQAQGFGVLTEIDVQATLRDKLRQDMNLRGIPGKEPVEHLRVARCRARLLRGRRYPPVEEGGDPMARPAQRGSSKGMGQLALTWRAGVPAGRPPLRWRR